MNLDGERSAASPWKRGRDEFGGACLITRHSFWEEFDDSVDANIDLNIDTKRAALKISASVVSLVSLTGLMDGKFESGYLVTVRFGSETLKGVLYEGSMLKKVYQDKAVKEKERCKIEMADYKERLRTGQTISSAIPIWQWSLPLDVQRVETSVQIEKESGESLRSPKSEICAGESDSEDQTEDKDSDVEASFEVEDCAENMRIKYSVKDEGGFDAEKRVGMAGDANLETTGDVITEERVKELTPLEEKGEEPFKGDELLPSEKRDSVSSEENAESLGK